jgi:hypothetical protein
MLNGIARALLTFVLAVFLVGFGVCGAYGVGTGLWIAFSAGSNDWMVALPYIPFSLVGFAIAWICGKSIANLWRKQSGG